MAPVLSRILNSILVRHWKEYVIGERAIYFFMAMGVTLTASTMVVVANLQRSQTLTEEILWSILSVAFCLASHILPAVRKQNWMWLAWCGFSLFTILGHFSFMTYASLEAGVARSKQSAEVLNIERQIQTIQKITASIHARPVTVIADELSVTMTWRKHDALKAELKEAERATRLQDELVRLTQLVSTIEEKGASDPATLKIARLVKWDEITTATAIHIGYSVLLEMLGVIAWYFALRPHEPLHDVDSKLATKPDSAAEIWRAVNAGKIKPTVIGIRKFLRCSQAKAMSVRREYLLRYGGDAAQISNSVRPG